MNRWLRYVQFLEIRMYGYLSIMKAVIQRVSKARVAIAGYSSQTISKGAVILLGIAEDDTIEDIPVLANKILNLRLFPKNKKMDLSIKDISGDLLIISQFTLYADCSKGNRPSFIKAAKSVHAKKIYTEFVNYMYNQNLVIKTGIFGKMMQVSLVNDGPVTIILDTKI